jgi:tetratricopeptide (TPR) repeat protein
MVSRVALFWIVLLALPWALWMRRMLQEQLKLRSQARQRQAAARGFAVQRHFEAGMRLLKEKRWAQAIDSFDSALDKLRNDPSQEASLLFYRGFALEQMDKVKEAIVDYQECQAVDRPLHQDPQYVAAVREGLLLGKLGRTEEAEQHLRQIIAALQHGPQSLSWLQVEAFQILVGLFHRVQDLARAIEYAQQGAQTAHRLHDAAAQAVFLRAAGDDLRALGHPEQALHSYEQSLDLHRRLGETSGGALVKRDIALLYQLQGQWDKALAWLQACLADEERDQNKQRQAQLCYDMACLRIDQGNLQEAGALLQQSISLFRQAEDHEGIDQVGRTMMGLSILVHRRVTAHQMTFRDVERGSAKSNKEGK